jgi:peptide deformylase
MGGTFAPPLCVVNPYILTYMGTPAPTIEGCLSLPGQFDLVERFPQVEVSFCTHDLENRVEMIFSGLEAQCFQHEYEHLQGKLFVDKLPGGRRDQIRSNLRKLKQSGKI